MRPWARNRNNPQHLYRSPSCPAQSSADVLRRLLPTFVCLGRLWTRETRRSAQPLQRLAPPPSRPQVTSCRSSKRCPWQATCPSLQRRLDRMRHHSARPTDSQSTASFNSSISSSSSMSAQRSNPRRRPLRRGPSSTRISPPVEQEVQRILAHWALRAVIARRHRTGTKRP